MLLVVIIRCKPTIHVHLSSTTDATTGSQHAHDDGRQSVQTESIEHGEAAEKTSNMNEEWHLNTWE